MSTTPLRPAAIQTICRPGPVAENLGRPETLIGKAAARGAKLALLPGRFPGAFRFDESAWLAASPADGAARTWSVEMVRKYRLYPDGSFPEVRGGGHKQRNERARRAMPEDAQ